MSFNINLIKDDVLPFKKRRAIFIFILSYLFFSLLIFIIVIINIMANLSSIKSEREAVAYAENIFCQNNPSVKSASAYNSDMKDLLKKDVNTLQTIDDVLSKRTNLTLLLIRFALPLSPGSYIDNFALDNSKNILSFNVITPASRSNDGSQASKLISAWKNDSTLMANIRHIESSASRREKIENDTSMILEFSCSLSKGGA